MTIRAQSIQILFAVVAPNGSSPQCDGLASRIDSRSFGIATHHAAGSPLATTGRPRARAVFGLAWEEPDSWCCARALKNLLSLSGR